MDGLRSQCHFLLVLVSRDANLDDRGWISVYLRSGSYLSSLRPSETTGSPLQWLSVAGAVQCLYECFADLWKDRKEIVSLLRRLPQMAARFVSGQVSEEEDPRSSQERLQNLPITPWKLIPGDNDYPEEEPFTQPEVEMVPMDARDPNIISRRRRTEAPQGMDITDCRRR
jgi:hypothetical protein